MAAHSDLAAGISASADSASDASSTSAAPITPPVFDFSVEVGTLYPLAHVARRGNTSPETSSSTTDDDAAEASTEPPEKSSKCSAKDRPLLLLATALRCCECLTRVCDGDESASANPLLVFVLLHSLAAQTSWKLKVKGSPRGLWALDDRRVVVSGNNYSNPSLRILDARTGREDFFSPSRTELHLADANAINGLCVGRDGDLLLLMCRTGLLRIPASRVPAAPRAATSSTPQEDETGVAAAAADAGGGELSTGDDESLRAPAYVCQNPDGSVLMLGVCEFTPGMAVMASHTKNVLTVCSLLGDAPDTPAETATVVCHDDPAKGVSLQTPAYVAPWAVPAALAARVPSGSRDGVVVGCTPSVHFLGHLGGASFVELASWTPPGVSEPSRGVAHLGNGVYAVWHRGRGCRFLSDAPLRASLPPADAYPYPALIHTESGSGGDGWCIPFPFGTARVGRHLVTVSERDNSLDVRGIPGEVLRLADAATPA